MTDASQRLLAAFPTAYGRPPKTCWSAPGRINLIGEHTDYNEGLALPFAIDRRTAVGAASASPGMWTVHSETEPAHVTFTRADLVPGVLSGWISYVAGVIAVLREEGIDIPGAEICICSDVPYGAGLSSSAALECAVLAALTDLAGADLPRERWPALARRAENAFAGVPCGILDQSASTLARDGHALLLDCRDSATAQIPLDMAEAGMALLVIDTRAKHSHASGEYADRRSACVSAAATLGVAALRDVDDLDTALARLGDNEMRGRVRHVVTENRRVRTTADLLRHSRFDVVGTLLTESHASLRDDFNVSSPELDLAVDAANNAGALGAPHDRRWIRRLRDRPGPGGPNRSHR